MEDVTNWKTLYRAAMLELDEKQIKGRIKAAREAIGRRSCELQFSNVAVLEEKQEIINAVSSLQYWETFNCRRESFESPFCEGANQGDETEQ